MDGPLDDLISELDNISSVKNEWSKEDQYEYNLLVTRSNFHQRILTDKEKPQVQRWLNYLTKHVTCGKNKNADKSCDDFVFSSQNELPNGRLPTGKQVLRYLFYTSNQNHGLQRAQNLHQVYIYSHIYTVTYKCQRKVRDVNNIN